MQVSPNSNHGPVTWTSWKSFQRAASSGGADTAQFDHATALDRALMDTPDLRPGEVERARVLIGDVSYPRPESVRRIASLLATNLADEPADT